MQVGDVRGVMFLEVGRVRMGNGSVRVTVFR